MLQATRRPRNPAGLFWPACCRLALLLALLAGAASPLAAQKHPGTLPDPDPAASAQYRRLRVRAVLVQRQYGTRAAPGQPLLREPAGYSEYDAQGRLVRQYSDEQPQWPRLVQRIDYSYDAAGSPTLLTVWDRLDPAADTTLLGAGWVPNSATHPAPAGGGEGYSTYWDASTGDWAALQRQRRTLRHDTTYLAAYNPRGQLLHASRSYAAGPRQLRLDELTYDDHGLRKASYHYSLTDGKGRVVESGQLQFGDPADPPHPQGAEPPRPTPAQDSVARHSAGRRVPEYTSTYNRRGQLTGRAAPGGLRATTRYNAAGQLLETQTFLGSDVVSTTRYTYLPNGLLAGVVLENAFRKRPAAFGYRYFYR